MPDYTILLIDYDPRSIERLRAPLLRAGLRVEVAKDGLAGIKLFHELRPDLTLIEAMIPKKHGFEVCQELKRTPHGQSSAILIITSVYKGRKYRSQAMHNYRCDEYLEKPITDEALVEIVTRHLPAYDAKPVPEPPESGPQTASPGLREVSRGVDTNPLRDMGDDELLDKLDELLPEGSERATVSDESPKANGSQEREGTPVRGARTPRNVVSFDIERARARTSAPASESGGMLSDLPPAPIARGTFSGGAPQPAILHDPLSIRRLEPDSGEHRPRPTIEPTHPERATRERLYFWIALVLAAALVAVVAVVAF